MNLFSQIKKLLSKNAFYQAVIDDNRAKVAQLISQKFDVNILDKNFNTPLHFAAQYKVAAVTQLLLEAGANPNLKNIDGDTPLSIICGNSKKSYEVGDNCLKITQLLLLHRADINTVNNEGQTPLFRAINQGHEPCANLLINKGDSLTYLDENENSALHLACIYQLPSVIETLLMAKVDINVKNKAGVTPLLFSCNHRKSKINLGIVKTLLNNNANPFIKDNLKNSPLKSMIQANNIEAATEILLTSQNRDEVLAFMDIMNEVQNKNAHQLDPILRQLRFNFYLDATPKEYKPEKKMKI
jgi:ankyrin repeat protein